MNTHEPYILRDDRGSWGGGIGYQLTDDLDIRYDWNLREKDRREVPGLGAIRTMEHTTINKSRVTVTAREAVNALGHKVGSSWNRHTIKLLDLKKSLKRLRPEDDEAINILDAHIEQQLAAVDALRNERAEVVKAAWRRAIPVQSIEVVDAAEANLAERTGQ